MIKILISSFIFLCVGFGGGYFVAKSMQIVTPPTPKESVVAVPPLNIVSQDIITPVTALISENKDLLRKDAESFEAEKLELLKMGFAEEKKAQQGGATPAQMLELHQSLMKKNEAALLELQKKYGIQKLPVPKPPAGAPLIDPTKYIPVSAEIQQEPIVAP